jgi:hypothetical protein
LDGRYLAINVERDGFVIAYEGYEPYHQRTKHQKLGSNLEKAELAVRCEELDHDCP